MTNTSNRTEIAQTLFAAHPHAKKFFMTSDNQAFLEEGDAKLHAKSLAVKDVEALERHAFKRKVAVEQPAAEQAENTDVSEEVSKPAVKEKASKTVAKEKASTAAKKTTVKKSADEPVGETIVKLEAHADPVKEGKAEVKSV